MARLFRSTLRDGVRRLVDPVARGLLRLRVSPDAVTVTGTVGVVAGALLFGARGQFLAATVVVAVFAVVDMVDGAMARARGYTTRFGALLDSTMDRIADGAVFGAIAYWYGTSGEPVVLAAALLCLVGTQVVSYVKARAEGLDIECAVGLLERPERLLLLGVGTLATGLGVLWALPTVLWLIAGLSALTAGQRIHHVYRADRGVTR